MGSTPLASTMLLFKVLWNSIWLNKTIDKTISEKVRHFPVLTFNG